jgi:hypothetical protein
MTPVDAAHAAMEAAPHDDAARLLFWGAVSEAGLFVMLTEEALEDRITPAEVEVEGARFVLAFDREDRLAEFAGGVAPYAELSGRRLALLLAGQGLGVALNPDVAPSAFLIGADAVDWLAGLEPIGPVEVEASLADLSAPDDAPEALMTAISRGLALATGMASVAWLAKDRSADTGQRYMLAVVGSRPGSEAALAAALSRAVIFSGSEAVAVDVAFVAAGSLAEARLAGVGIRFDVPRPAVVEGSGREETRPPRLR